MDGQILAFAKSVRFLEPQKLELLYVVPALLLIITGIWLLRLMTRASKTHGSRYPILGKVKFELALIVAQTILICAWARPYVERGKVEVNYGNVEVIFVVDGSVSMFLKDTGWSRIDIATREINKLLAHDVLRKGDRASLFILGVTGMLRAHLTNDLESFAHEVSKVGRPKSLLWDVSFWGSNVSSTLKRVYTSTDHQDKFAEFGRKEPESWRPRIKKNRLIIFFSDGDYFDYTKEEAAAEKKDREELNAALAELRQRGLKIYPVGIGTRAGMALSEVLKDYKFMVTYDDKDKSDLEGKSSRLNVEGLDYLRRTTGGSGPFLMENTKVDAMPFLKKVIDSHRTNTIKPGVGLDPQEIQDYFLAAALIIALIGIVITKFN